MDAARVIGPTRPRGDGLILRAVNGLHLRVLSLRYSSWSMRPWLALTHAGADFDTETVELQLGKQDLTVRDDRTADEEAARELRARRGKGSVTGLFPVLSVNDTPIHESLAICEWANEAYPEARLLPETALDRARVRAISSEMTSGFAQLRTHMSCHLFGRVPSFVPSAATRREIARIFEIWLDALDRSGGPFLFGPFGIADATYFPVRTRFRTYGVDVPEALGPYVRALDALPAVRALEQMARTAPAVPVYDAYLRSLGGNPTAAL
jgi:glutathione S-transferase